MILRTGITLPAGADAANDNAEHKLRSQFQQQQQHPVVIVICRICSLSRCHINTSHKARQQNVV